MNIDARIARGQRLKMLLEDPAVLDVLQQLDERGRATFQNAVTDEARRNVWALMNGMSELRRQLSVLVEDGEVALAEREQADKRAALQRGTGTA